VALTQQSPEDLSTTSSRISDGGCRSDEDREDEDESEDINVSHESDEEMRLIPDPIPCYPSHILQGHPTYAPGPPGAHPPLPGSWPPSPFNFLQHHLAFRHFDSKFLGPISIVLIL
jgi:hypothetical protein